MSVLKYKTIFPDAHIVQFRIGTTTDSIKVQNAEIAHKIARELAFLDFITVVKPL